MKETKGGFFMGFWYENTLVYHIYPLGFCGAPKFNEGGEVVYRLDKVISWIPHLKEMNVGAVYFGPVFESAEHGYDTTDYKIIDRRLGDNASFKKICGALHEAGIKIILDGVFNHVGRNFPGFKDVQERGSNSEYCSWFKNLNPGGKSPYGDNFSYEGWQGHYNLVKLNLRNNTVCDYLLDVVNFWINEFDVDGIRFDAADCIEFDFFTRVRSFAKSKKSDFWLMGEIIHGDYKRWANPQMLDSVTNYECYKGIFSSHNDKNYFEINYSINRQTGNGGIYKDITLYTFVDNHDVNRLASALTNTAHLKNCYTLLYTMPGVPSVYYGSEYGIKGAKANNSDDNLRPDLDLKELGALGGENAEIYRHIINLGKVRALYPAIGRGEFVTVLILNRQMLFMRRFGHETVYIALNLDDREFRFEFDSREQVSDVLGGLPVECNGNRASVNVPAFSSAILAVGAAAEPQETITATATPVETEKIAVKYEVSGTVEINGVKGEVIALAKDVKTKKDTVVYRDGNGAVWTADI